MEKPETSPSTSSALAPRPTAHEKMPNLDGLRALACIGVVVSHTPLAQSIHIIGTLGVGVFFALSGFLMSFLYIKQPYSHQSTVHYGIARFSRIAPIYWLAIFSCFLLSFVAGDDFQQGIYGPTSLARHILFSGSAGVFWSIPLEIQYYFFFIFLWWGAANYTKRSYAMPLVAIVCIFLLLTGPYWPNLSVPNKLHYFLAGSIAGALPRINWQEKAKPWMLWLAQFACLTMLLMAFFIFNNRESEVLFGSIANSLAMAALVYFLSYSSPWTWYIFATPLMRKLGAASFSIYLFHVVILHFGSHWLGLSHQQIHPLWIALILLAIALPVAISQFIEIPLQRKTRSLLEALFARQEAPKPADGKAQIANS